MKNINQMINIENISTGNLLDNYNIDWTQKLLDYSNQIPNEKNSKEYIINLVSNLNDYFPNDYRDNINFLNENEKFCDNKVSGPILKVIENYKDSSFEFMIQLSNGYFINIINGEVYLYSQDFEKKDRIKISDKSISFVSEISDNKFFVISKPSIFLLSIIKEKIEIEKTLLLKQIKKLGIILEIDKNQYLISFIKDNNNKESKDIKDDKEIKVTYIAEISENNELKLKTKISDYFYEVGIITKGKKAVLIYNKDNEGYLHIYDITKMDNIKSTIKIVKSSVPFILSQKCLFFIENKIDDYIIVCGCKGKYNNSIFSVQIGEEIKKSYYNTGTLEIICLSPFKNFIRKENNEILNNNTYNIIYQKSCFVGGKQGFKLVNFKEKENIESSQIELDIILEDDEILTKIDCIIQSNTNGALLISSKGKGILKAYLEVYT